MSTDGTALTVQNAGYYEGVTDVYYALMTGMDAPNQAPVYGPAVCAGKSIEVQAAPNYRERKVYASNVATRRDQLPDSYTVTLNLDQVIPAVRKVLLGRKDGGNGVELITGMNAGPWVALLFAATLDDGSTEYRQLYKGRFSEPTATHHTKNDGDSYQHPTITGTFVRLGNNDQIGNIKPDDGVIAEGRNLLLNTSEEIGIMTSSMNGSTAYVGVTSFSPAMMADQPSITEVTISYDWELVWKGTGEAPALPTGGKIIPYSYDGVTRKTFGITTNVTAQSGHESGSATVDFGRTRRFKTMGFRGTNMPTAPGWVLLIRNLKFEIGSSATAWTPAPEDYGTSVMMPVSESVTLQNARVYRGTSSPYTYATVTPVFGGAVNSYVVTAEKTANNQGWYFSPSMGAGVTGNVTSDPSTVKWSNGVIMTYDRSGLTEDSISASVQSSGMLLMYLGGGVNKSHDAVLRVTLRKGSESNTYQFRMVFTAAS